MMEMPLVVMLCGVTFAFGVGAGIFLSKHAPTEATSHGGDSIQPAIYEIAEIFRSGSLSRKSLNRHGISEMSVRYLGKDVTVSWYSMGHLHNISLGGDQMFATGKEANYIGDAAKARAEKLFHEAAERLETERRSQVA